MAVQEWRPSVVHQQQHAFIVVVVKVEIRLHAGAPPMSAAFQLLLFGSSIQRPGTSRKAASLTSKLAAWQKLWCQLVQT